MPPCFSLKAHKSRRRTAADHTRIKKRPPYHLSASPTSPPRQWGENHPEKTRFCDAPEPFSHEKHKDRHAAGRRIRPRNIRFIKHSQTCLPRSTAPEKTFLPCRQTVTSPVESPCIKEKGPFIERSFFLLPQQCVLAVTVRRNTGDKINGLYHEQRIIRQFQLLQIIPALKTAQRIAQFNNPV